MYKKSATQVQSEISNLRSTVDAIQGSLGTAIDAALADGLADINAVITQLETQVDNIATGDDVDNISATLGGVEQDIKDLLASNNVFTGDLTINSEATLEFAESLGDKVKIVNGNVTVKAPSDLDGARLQTVVDRIRVITQDLTIRAASSSAPYVSLDSLSGVGNIKVAQAGSISFATLKSALEITIGNNYQSKLDGMIHFGGLTSVTKFVTGEIASNGAVSGDTDNAIILSKASGINLGALPYYTPRTLTLEADDEAALNLASLKSVDANDRERAYTVSIKGALDFNVPGLTAGEVTVEDVVNVNLAAFKGKITIKDGVENVTMGALANDFTASTNDLVTVNLTADAADKSIDLTGAQGLLSATIAGKIEGVTFSGNNDLETLDITAALQNLTIDNTSLEAATLEHTNSNLVEKSSLVVINNEDLTSLTADNVDGLATLTITGNEELETISFASLKAIPTKAGAGAKVTIGGSTATANALNAIDINQDAVDSKDGAFITDSGVDGLKAYLTAAAAVGASVLKVYFDSADDFTDGTPANTATNLVIGSDAARLVVVDKVAAANPAAASKRTFLFSYLAGSGIMHDLHFNGATITITEGSTPADFVSNITSEANLTAATNNGVTLTANANAYPSADAVVSMAASAFVVSATTASSTGNADSVTLKIGDYSAKLYLVTTLDATFTADPMAADDKTAENQFLVTPTTTVTNVLDALRMEFDNAFSPYSPSLLVGVTSGTLRIFPKDYSDKEHGTAVSFTSSNDDAIGKTSVNVAGTTVDDTLIGNRVQITLVSNVEGELLSEIGNPPNLIINGGGITPSSAAIGTAGFSSIAGAAVVWEFGAYSTATTAAAVTYTEDLTDSPSATNVGLEAGTAAMTTNRIGWL